MAISSGPQLPRVGEAHAAVRRAAPGTQAGVTPPAAEAVFALELGQPADLIERDLSCAGNTWWDRAVRVLVVMRMTPCPARDP